MAAINISGGDVLIEDVYIDNLGTNATPAIEVGAAVRVRIHNVDIVSGGGILFSAGDGSLISDCVIVDPDGYGIQLLGPTGGVVVANNTIKNASGGASVAALIVDGDGNGTRDVAIVGNVIEGGVDGVSCVDVDELVMVGNNIKAFATGIDLNDVNRSRIADNQVGGYPGIDIELTEHGIFATGCADTSIVDNTVVEPGVGTDNTYDGIHLAGDSNRNHIAGNTVIPSTVANATRYGVNVSAATCDDNVVADNVLGAEADYGTASFNDAGTGTVTTRDANGQFTW